METVFNEFNESVFNMGLNIVIGVIYRMPNSSVDVFNDRISDILNVTSDTRVETRGSENDKLSKQTN